jgi:transcriptional regulator with GAF, ATPase, and Fis domain
LDLTEVQKAMVPGAQAALKQTLDFFTIREAHQLTVVDEALRQSNGNQELAARRLGVSPAYISDIVNGKVLKKRTGGSKPHKKSEAEAK